MVLKYSKTRGHPLLKKFLDPPLARESATLALMIVVDKIILMHFRNLEAIGHLYSKH